MTYLSDSVPVSYHGDGPMYPGEDAHQALGENTAFSVAGHLLSRPAQGVNPGTFSHPAEPVADAHPMAQPGGSIEDEPTDAAEKASQHTAQTVAKDTRDVQGDEQLLAPVLSHHEVGASVRAAVRGGVV